MKLSRQESFKGSTDTRLTGLEVYQDKMGLIRTRSLVSNCDDKYGFRYHIILDHKHPLVELPIRYAHQSHNHAGMNTVLKILREQVWVTLSRRTIRNVITRCVAAAESAMQLYLKFLEWTTQGHFFLKNGQKAWICLFACAVYRAVHFELVTTLSAEGFLQALRRFIARRGRPSCAYSDNGTNFVKADRLQASWTGKRSRHFVRQTRLNGISIRHLLRGGVDGGIEW